MSQLPTGITMSPTPTPSGVVLPGTVVMGSIRSGQLLSYHLSSGSVGNYGFTSGMDYHYNINSGDIISGQPTWHYCSLCKKYIGGSGDMVSVHGISGLYLPCCWECGGFTYQHPVMGDGFHQRYNWIMDSIPLTQDTPLPIIADWLEENHRQKDSDYIKKCDQILSSR